MGTQYQVTVNPIGLAQNHIAFDHSALGEQLERRLSEINQQMSTYISGSELSRFNQLPKDSCLEISWDLYHVLELSKSLYERSEGAFDISVGALVNRWGFGPDEISHPPDAEEVASLLADQGLNSLHLDASSQTACKKSRLNLDLSAIAKGYAVDRLALLLEELGVNSYLVDIGGELRASGQRPGEGPWRLALESPVFARGSVHAVIALHQGAVATSGDYRNFRDYQGSRYSHTIDPQTGNPVRHNTASVTVIAANAAEADAWATALNVVELGLAKRLAEKNALATYIMYRDGLAPGADSADKRKSEAPIAVWYSNEFAPYLQAQD